ncbi:hypothetical protein C437_16686 [Haloarcula vallismortis ATCC 29715]|uniref:PGF-CTERM archaeal protein-sorting signal domain-containing protein n=1 Tax=Haloarcula vallismortis ATCC 29715 TaxID=662477 RepID=M0J168_HALVA|nr:hypothetical protein C437_16686 [Haloarcula vallismortis ATCC 29715]
MDDGQTTAVTENVDVWERSLLPLRTSSTGPTAIAAPQTYINIESAQTGDVPLNREEYTIHQAGESVDLTFESTTGAGTTGVAGDEAQLLAVRLSEDPTAAGFSEGSARTDLASIFTNDSNANSVELLDDAEGVGSIDDNGVLETSYTPDAGGAYGFILVTVDDGEGLSVSDNNVSADGNVTVVGVEQTLVQESPATVNAAANDVAAGNNVSLDIETELEDDSVTHAVLLFDENELQQRTSTVRVTGDIDEDFSEDQVTVENSFDGVNGVSSVDDDATLTGDSTAVEAMPSAGLVGLFGFVLSEASPESTGDDVLHASATTVSGASDTTVDVETLDSWTNGTYTYVHIAVGEDSNEINSATGTITLSQSNETDGGDGNDDGGNSGGGDDGDDGDNNDGDDDGDNNGGSNDGNSNSGGSNDGDNDSDSGDDNSDSEGTEDESTTDTADQTTTDDSTEIEDEGGQTETTTTADDGGGAQQPDDTATAGTEGSVETTSSSGPGFTVLVAVLALLGAGFLARRD